MLPQAGECIGSGCPERSREEAASVAQASISILIALLRDGEKGFLDLAGRVEHPECRDFLLEESALRGVYADQLERSTADTAGKIAHESGTRLGTLHRRWTALKALVGAGDHVLLETTELCEWFAVKAYDQTLRDRSLPGDVRAMVADQARGVHQSREIVQELRRLTKR